MYRNDARMPDCASGVTMTSNFSLELDSVFFREALQKFAHRTPFAALGLLEAAADAANALQQRPVIEKLLICLRTLHDKLSLSIDRENKRFPGLLQALNMLAGVPLEFTERVDVGEAHRHTM